MTLTLTVETWLDNIIPRTDLLKPIPTFSNIPFQSQHHGKRKRSLEHAQPKNPQLNQQEYSEIERYPNKYPRIEPISQRTRSNLRRLTSEAMSQTPVNAQVWSDNSSVARPQLILHYVYSNLLH